MFNFSDNTAKEQHDHDHDHDPAGFDMGPKAHKDSNSETTHGKKEPLQHKKEKEPKDMTSTFNNRIAPVLAALAVALTFLLVPMCKVSGFDLGKLKEDDLSNIASSSYDVKNLDYGYSGRLEEGRQLTRSDDEKFVFDGESRFADTDDSKLNDWEENKLADIGGADRVCSDSSWCAGISDGKFFNVERDGFGEDMDYSRAEEDKPINSREMKVDDRVDVEFERADADKFKGNDDEKIKAEGQAADEDRNKSDDDYRNKAVDGGWGKLTRDNRKDFEGGADATRETVKVIDFDKSKINVPDVGSFVFSQDTDAGDFITERFSQDDFDDFTF